MALITAALTAAVCLGLLIGYYTIRARSYDALDLVLEGDFPIEADDEIGFVPSRNASTWRRHPKTGLSYHLFTSDRGARVSAAGDQTPPRVDLLTIGCSFSWGHGIENPETYTALVAQRTGMRAANLSFSSYGTVQAVQMLERNLDLHPRVVVYGVIQDHVKRNLSGCAPTYGPACLPCAWVDFDAGGRPFLHPPDRDAFAFNRRFWDVFFFHRGSWAERLVVTMKADARRIAGGTVQTPDPAHRQASLQFLLGRMRADAAKIGAELVIVFIPYLERGGTNTIPPALSGALASIAGEGVSVLDLAPAVERYYADPDRPLLRFERDAHPNGLAHALIADELAATLRRRGLVAPP